MSRIHILEPEPFKLLPSSFLPEKPSAPGHLRDVLDLAELEAPRWPEMLGSIDGPTAALSHIMDGMANAMLAAIPAYGLSSVWELILCTGNPGPTGVEHQFNFEVGFPKITWGAAASRKISNSKAAVFVEIKKTATITFALLSPNGQPYGAYAELAAPVTPEIGDTLRVNIGGLVVEIP